VTDRQDAYRGYYRGRRVMITGGLGFIGSNLARQLVDLGAREIEIFGDGSQMRDFVFVEDAADAFLRAGASDVCDGDVFNVGGAQPITHRDLVALLVDTAGAGRVRYVDWPPEKKRIDIGSFYSDSTKFQRASGWTPTVDLREGLRRTLAFYRAHLAPYVEAEL
jgi:UDP-glucose 4-epimerase